MPWKTLQLFRGRVCPPKSELAQGKNTSRAELLSLYVLLYQQLLFCSGSPARSPARSPQNELEGGAAVRVWPSRQVRRASYISSPGRCADSNFSRVCSLHHYRLRNWSYCRCFGLISCWDHRIGFHTVLCGVCNGWSRVHVQRGVFRLPLCDLYCEEGVAHF